MVLMARHVLRRMKPAVRIRGEPEPQSWHGVDQPSSTRANKSKIGVLRVVRVRDVLAGVTRSLLLCRGGGRGRGAPA